MSLRITVALEILTFPLEDIPRVLSYLSRIHDVFEYWVGGHGRITHPQPSWAKPCEISGLKSYSSPSIHMEETPREEETMKLGAIRGGQCWCGLSPCDSEKAHISMRNRQ